MSVWCVLDVVSLHLQIDREHAESAHAKVDHIRFEGMIQLALRLRAQALTTLELYVRCACGRLCVSIQARSRRLCAFVSPSHRFSQLKTLKRQLRQGNMGVFLDQGRDQQLDEGQVQAETMSMAIEQRRQMLESDAASVIPPVSLDMPYSRSRASSITETTFSGGRPAQSAAPIFIRSGQKPVGKSDTLARSMSLINSERPLWPVPKLSTSAPSSPMMPRPQSVRPARVVARLVNGDEHTGQEPSIADVPRSADLEQQFRPTAQAPFIKNCADIVSEFVGSWTFVIVQVRVDNWQVDRNGMSR